MMLSVLFAIFSLLLPTVVSQECILKLPDISIVVNRTFNHFPFANKTEFFEIIGNGVQTTNIAEENRVDLRSRQISISATNMLTVMEWVITAAFSQPVLETSMDLGGQERSFVLLAHMNIQLNAASSCDSMASIGIQIGRIMILWRCDASDFRVHDPMAEPKNFNLPLNGVQLPRYTDVAPVLHTVGVTCCKEIDVCNITITSGLGGSVSHLLSMPSPSTFANDRLGVVHSARLVTQRLLVNKFVVWTRDGPLPSPFTTTTNLPITTITPTPTTTIVTTQSSTSTSKISSSSPTTATATTSTSTTTATTASTTPTTTTTTDALQTANTPGDAIDSNDSNNGNGSQTYIIIGAVGAFVLLAVILVVVCIVVKSRKTDGDERPNKASHSDEDVISLPNLDYDILPAGVQSQSTSDASPDYSNIPFPDEKNDQCICLFWFFKIVVFT
jgi:hypothetical protein